MTSRRGLFVSLEGIDGAGKSTQVAALAAALEAAGHRVVVVREPGGTEGGELIRDVALHRRTEPPLRPWAEALLMVAARVQLLAEVVVPALERGDVVIADRFVDSTLAYQGAGRGLHVEDLRALHRAACGDLWPDLTVLLGLSGDVALERRRGARLPLDRMETDGEAGLLVRVAEGFRALAAAEPDRVVTVDAGRTPAEIGREVWALVSARLASAASGAGLRASGGAP